jgi:uncharacterized protein (DUF1778 family)
MMNPETLSGSNLTDLALDADRKTAQNAPSDQSVIHLNNNAYAAFVALLDAPPQPNNRLRKSLQTPAPWD